MWLLVATVGEGTRTLARLREGDMLNCVLPLGNTFAPLASPSERVLLVGGGVGVAPLLFFGKQIKEAGGTPVFLLGARTAADLAVFRSGAIGLAELAVRGIPSVLIPYPYAAEDHQTYNARIFVQEGAAHMIVDQMLSAHDLIGEIEMFMANRDLLSQMGERALQLGKPNATHNITNIFIIATYDCFARFW